MFRVPLSWENLRPSACRNILFILTSVVTLVRGGCLAAGAIFSAWGWEHLLARQLAPPFTPKASKWMLLGSWFYWGLCWVFCLVHVSMWCCFGSSISKLNKTPAHPLCLWTHGSGKFKYNFQQSGGGESNDDDDDDDDGDDDCQVRRAVRTDMCSYYSLEHKSVPTALVMWSSLRQCSCLVWRTFLSRWDVGGHDYDSTRGPTASSTGKRCADGDGATVVVEFVDHRECFGDSSSSKGGKSTCSRCWVKHQMILIIQRTGRTGVVKSVPQNSTKSFLSTSEASRAKNTLISRCPRSRKNLNVMLGMPFLWAIQTANSCSFQNSSCQGETYAEDAEGGKDGWIVGPYRATRSP